MTELEKLKKRLFDMGVRNVHVDWTDEGRTLSAEAKAAEMNRALDAIEAGDYDEIDPADLD